MKTSQALLLCGCFAEGISAAFDYGDKLYRLTIVVEGDDRFFELNISGLCADAVPFSFPIADMSVGNGFLTFDLGAELEIRIPLEDYKEGKE